MENDIYTLVARGLLNWLHIKANGLDEHYRCHLTDSQIRDMMNNDSAFNMYVTNLTNDIMDYVFGGQEEVE